jgi:hypothetical protein
MALGAFSRVVLSLTPTQMPISRPFRSGTTTRAPGTIGFAGSASTA